MTNTAHDAALPSELDLAAPKDFETATFALG